MRVGKRTAFAEWVMAHDMLAEELIDADSALLRVDANRLEELFKRRVKAEGADADREGAERVARRGDRQGGLHGRRGRAPAGSRASA